MESWDLALSIGVSGSMIGPLLHCRLTVQSWLTENNKMFPVEKRVQLYVFRVRMTLFFCNLAENVRGY